MCSERGDASEKEITPEMVEAGTFELSSFDPDLDSGSEFVKRVFLAMVAARDRAPQDI